MGYNLNVAGTTVSGTFAVNGAAPPASNIDDGTFVLRNAAGDSAMLTNTDSVSGTSYTAVVVPGTYDLYYVSGSANSSGVPRNISAKIQTGIVVGTSALSLNLNVAGTTVSGTFAVNGAAPPASNIDDGTFVLRNAAGDSAMLTNTDSVSGTSYTAMVVPGTYDLYYVSGSANSSAVPRNTSAKIQTGIVVGTSALSLNLNVAGTTVSGTFAVNGAAPPGSNIDDGTFVLRNAAGDSAMLTNTDSVSGTSYTAMVVPGTYDLYYVTGSANSSGVPRNISAKIQTGIVVGTSALTLNLNVAGTTVSGTFAVNGAAPPASNIDDGTFVLRNAAGDSAMLTNTDSVSGTSYTAMVVPGTYDLYYVTGSANSSGVPRNTSAKIQTGIVVGTSALTLNLNVAGTTVSGTFAVNGAAPPASNIDDGTFVLRNAAGDSAMLTNTDSVSGTSYTAMVVPGTYDLYYVTGSANSSGVPRNISAKIQTGIVVGTSALTLNLNVAGTTVSGTFAVNGAAPPASNIDDGTFVLRNAAGDSAMLTNTDSVSGTSYTAMVVPGTYELYYVTGSANSSAVPRNTLADLGCFVVPSN